MKKIFNKKKKVEEKLEVMKLGNNDPNKEEPKMSNEDKVKKLNELKEQIKSYKDELTELPPKYEEPKQEEEVKEVSLEDVLNQILLNQETIINYLYSITKE